MREVIKLSLSIGVNFVLFFSLCFSLQAEEIEVTNGVMTLAFDDSSFALKRLESDGFSYYFSPIYSPIWAITLLDAYAHPVDTSDLHYHKSTQLVANKSYQIVDSLGGKLLSLYWQDIDIVAGTLSISVWVHLPPGSPESRWRIEAQNTSTQYSIFSLDFPYISPTDLGADLNTLIYPSHAGAIFNAPFQNAHIGVRKKDDIDPMARIWRTVYPGPISMQYIHFYDSFSENGLFFSPLDTASYFKRYNVYGLDSLLVFFIRHYPEDNHIPHQDYSIPYDFLLQPVSGDWISVAKFYRSLVSSFPWMQPKGRKNRGDLIFELKRKVVLNPDTLLLNLQHFFGDSIKIGFRSNFKWPDFLASGDLLPQDEQFIDSAVASGFRVAPYASTRNWYWPPQGDAATGVARNINDDFYKGDGWIMCPASSFWDGLYPSRVNKLLSFYGATDVYMDNYPQGRLCYSEFHQHKKGGGRYWLDGYRRMFSQIRAANPEADMINESRAECLIPYFDAGGAKYWENSSHDKPFAPDGAFPIPLVACVYHDYLGFYGGANRYWHEFEGNYEFAFSQAYCFVNGNKLSLCPDSLYVSQFSAQRLEDWKYVRLLTRYVHFAPDYLYFGTWERPPSLSGFPNTTVEFPNYPPMYQTLDTSSVLSGAFESKEDALGLPFTNFTDDSVSGSFSVNLTDYDMLPGFYYVYELDTSGAVTFIDSLSGDDYQKSLVMGPRSAKFFVITDQILCQKGEVNNDGTIDILDVVLTVNIILELYDPNAQEFCAADFDSNDEIDVLDVVQIVNEILGGKTTSSKTRSLPGRAGRPKNHAFLSSERGRR